MRTDYSCYEGMELAGGVDTVLSRGQVIISGNQYHGKKGDGQYLPRDLNQYLV
jgi:dihydropyrimidinase